jgi:Hint domain
MGMKMPLSTTYNPEKPPTRIHRSRRNLIKIGAIAASVILARLTEAKPAVAGPAPAPTPVPAPRPSLPCFLKGTTIRTAGGGRRVEDLAVGDLLPTVFGGICPIQWIGRYPFKKSDPTKAWIRAFLPVRIARSALGPDVPHTDLYVTQAHALLIDGVLVTAGSLINDTTITLYDARERDELEFFHIKLARHDVIYAEGAPCETLIRIDETAVNFADYRQYGSLNTKDDRCAPLLDYSGGRNQIKSRFRSAISPWIDRRQKFDIIRDELEEAGINPLRQTELT